MSGTGQGKVILTEKGWIALIFFSTAIVLLISVYCLANGITIVFMHLYYFPIILLTYHYRWKGFILSILLSFAYGGLVWIFNLGNTDVLLTALLRIIVFISIAAIIETILIYRDLTGRRHIEEALQESEIRFQTMVEASPDIIWEIDPEGNFTFISSQARDQLGYEPAELIGKPFFSLILPESVSAVKQHFITHVSEKKSFTSLVVPACHKDGRSLFIEIRSVTIKDDAGQVSGFRGIARDITEYRRKDDELKQSEKKFRELFTRMPSAVAIYEAAGNGTDFIFKDFNTAAETIEGIKKSDLVGKHLLEVFPRVIEFGIIEVFKRVWKTGKAEYYPATLYTDEHDHSTLAGKLGI